MVDITKKWSVDKALEWLKNAKCKSTKSFCSEDGEPSCCKVKDKNDLEMYDEILDLPTDIETEACEHALLNYQREVR